MAIVKIKSCRARLKKPEYFLKNVFAIFSPVNVKIETTSTLNIDT